MDLDNSDVILLIQSSINACENLNICLSCSSLPSLHLLDRLLQFIQSNYTSLIPFVTGTFDTDTSFFSQVFPSALLLPPADKWTAIVGKLILSTVTHLRHVIYSDSTVPDVADLKDTCSVLQDVVRLFEAMITSALFYRYQPEAQLLFETQNVCILITSQVILIPKASRGIRTLLSKLDISTDVFQHVTRANEVIATMDEDDVKYPLSSDLVLNFHLFESFLTISERHERAKFLKALIEMIGVEGGISRKSGVSHTFLGLATLKYVACSFPFPGLTPRCAALSVCGGAEDVHLSLQAPCILPICCAGIVECICALARRLETHDSAAIVDVNVTMKPIFKIEQICEELESGLSLFQRCTASQEKVDPAILEIARPLSKLHSDIRKRALDFIQVFTRHTARRDRESLTKLQRASTPTTLALENNAPLALSDQQPDQPEDNELMIPTRKPPAAKRRSTIPITVVPETVHPAPAEAMSLSDLLVNVPEQMLSAFVNVNGLLVLCVGRFPQTSVTGVPWVPFLQTIGLSVEGFVNTENVGPNVSQTAFLKCILDFCPLFIISAFLADDLNGHLQIKAASLTAHTCVTSTHAYNQLYNYLPKERCRSMQWLLDVLRCKRHLPSYTNPSTPLESWLIKLPPKDTMNTILHLAPSSIPYLRDDDQDILPSRNVFVLAAPSLYTICHHPVTKMQIKKEDGIVKMEPFCDMDELPEPMIDLATLPFVYASREALARLVRSPTRNVLLSGSTGRSLLEPLLQSSDSTVRVLVILPKGFDVNSDRVFNGAPVVDGDIKIETMISEAICADVAPLQDLVTHYEDQLLIDMVNFEWLEDSFLARQVVNPQSYRVDSRTSIKRKRPVDTDTGNKMLRIE